jgi:hypothetical protein
LFLKYCLNNGIEDLLCVEIIECIINIRTSFGKDDYDYEWEEQGRRFFIIFNSNYKGVMYIHDEQKVKVYRNFNDNYEKDKFFNIDESFPNFNLSREDNKQRISRLLQENNIEFNGNELEEILVSNDKFKKSG